MRTRDRRPMSSELSRLEDIVTNQMAAFIEQKFPASEELISDFKVAMHEETERIKNRIMLAVFSSDRKKELSHLVQIHQQSLIGMVTQLLRYTYPEKIVGASSEIEASLLCHYAYRSLDDLLNFVERHFTHHFNQDTWVPGSYQVIVGHEIKQHFGKLENDLREFGVRDSDLSNIVFTSFAEFLTSKDTNEVTYRKVKYLKTLASELLDVVSNGEVEDADDVLRGVLVRLNYNSVSFFTHYTNHIDSQVSKLETQAEKLERLAFFLKAVNQVRDKPGYVFDPKYPSIKEQISGWIVEEMNFREKSRQLEISFPLTTNGGSVAEAIASKEIKIQMDLSVAQAACLVRGMVECGMIQNKNVSELIRLVAGIIHTKRSGEVSAESFRMKYYNIEDSARQAVAKRLREIAEYLMKR